ncbi:hypothetical protein ACGFK1_22435 [Mycobacterium sp. NPDC048908]|uniref:hypothetical protein n=1 Tax=Mycobacterium sp. NPDC048908 TaxID=3364292 RepID=UPI00372013EB
MKKITYATAVAGALAAVAGALAALAVGLASQAAADGGSGSNVVAPAPVYPQSAYGGANPYTPYGVDPYVPYGVWAQR